MVHVARGHLREAAAVLERGLSRENTGPIGSSRYPGSGLHWLLGLIRWTADDDRAGAREELERELAFHGTVLYAAEYSMNAFDGLGFLALDEGRAADADAMFSQSLVEYPDHPRSIIGMAQTLRAQNEPARADELMQHADRAIHELIAGGRKVAAATARAHWQVVSGQPEAACETLLNMIDAAPPGTAGWNLPVEPWLAPIRETAACQRVFARLRERAH
jgi:hypothetical protein